MSNHPPHDGQGFGDQSSLQVREQGVGRHLHVHRTGYGGPRVHLVLVGSGLGPRLELAGRVGCSLQFVEGQVPGRAFGQVKGVGDHGQGVRIRDGRQFTHQEIHRFVHAASVTCSSLIYIFSQC